MPICILRARRVLRGYSIRSHRDGSVFRPKYLGIPKERYKRLPLREQQPTDQQKTKKTPI